MCIRDRLYLLCLRAGRSIPPKSVECIGCLTLGGPSIVGPRSAEPCTGDATRHAARPAPRAEAWLLCLRADRSIPPKRVECIGCLTLGGPSI
eukprot:14430938-Alexandrium_andersonii.AAC.1